MATMKMLYRNSVTVVDLGEGVDWLDANCEYYS